MRRTASVACGLALALCGCSSDADAVDEAHAPKRASAGPAQRYQVIFAADISTTAPIAHASITVQQDAPLVKSLDFNAPASRYTPTGADGDVSHERGRLVWTPPAGGGVLRYTYKIDSPRGDSYDARYNPDWVLLRLGDLFPAARARTRKGARSDSSVSLRGPASWSFESRYGTLTNKARMLPRTARNFTRPTGWLVGGKLGTRRDTVNGRRVVVSAPVGSGVRRLDTLAFLGWTLPHLTRVFPQVPERLLIAGAPEEMWRGGLSAPGSLYLHAARPLISENGTSTLLHELIHLGDVHSAEDGADWVVEGIAEYYSLLILRRSAGISARRFEQTIGQLQAWVAKDGGALRDPSKGVDTAAAVLTLHALAGELQAAGSHIDELISRLLAGEAITEAALRTAAATLLGHPSEALGKARDKAS